MPLTALHEQEQARRTSLVRMFQNMKPTEAARIFEQMEMPTLVEIGLVLGILFVQYDAGFVVILRLDYHRWLLALGLALLHGRGLGLGLRSGSGGSGLLLGRRRRARLLLLLSSSV